MEKAKTSSSMPELQDFLKAGVQFGHQVKKWNPKMSEFIYTKRDNIHIIDLSKTIEMLAKAVEFLQTKAKEGEIVFVGTKRQAATIVKEMAVEAGAHFIVHRWPGGLLTNFELIQKSLRKLNTLEQEFEKGVEDRTKFEVSLMKKEWQKMNRLYEGVKKMNKKPVAVVIVDSKFERGAVKEARKIGIPIIALVDTNADPSKIDYPIPANDDAIRSIQLIMAQLAQAVKKGNEGKGIEHSFKDYTKFEVKLLKSEVKEEEEKAVDVQGVEVKPVKVVSAPVRIEKKKDSGNTGNKGILEGIQEEKESKKVTKAKKSRSTK